MKHIINIGLAVPNSNNMISTEAALAALADVFGATPARWHVAQSGTEPTLVAEVHAARSHVYPQAHRVSVALSQDCIAVYCPARHTGALVGPKSADWGAFNMAAFVGMAE